MAHFDIFNDDAFSVSQLTQTIVDIPRVPTMLGDMGLFNEASINTTSMSLERMGNALQLVPNQVRGGPGQTLKPKGRKLLSINAMHLPQVDRITADEVQNVRAFGSETELQSVQKVVAGRISDMKANIDLTMEWQRIGGVKGKIMDADGTTELLDIYSLMGKTQTRQAWNIPTAATAVDPKQLCVNLKRAMRNALGGRMFRRPLVICNPSFFDKFVGHNNMKAAWERWNEGAFNRTDQTQADFEFAGVVFRIYDYTIGANPVIEDGIAYAVPEGVPGMFQQWFAPADYMETVNTNGVPYYAKQWADPSGKFVTLESQSNPITLNTLPEAVIKLDVAAS